MGNAGVALGAGVEMPPAAPQGTRDESWFESPAKRNPKALKEQSGEEIGSRIQQAAGDTQDKLKVVAIQKLKSGYIAIHVDSSKSKKGLEAETTWVTSIAPGATVHKRT